MMDESTVMTGPEIIKSRLAEKYTTTTYGGVQAVTGEDYLEW